LTTVTPYRPRRKRDPRVAAIFWEGIYLALLVGLLAGAALWAFLVMGGAPFADSRARAVATLTACAGLGALFSCAWGWGRRALGTLAPDWVADVGARLEWLVWPFVMESQDEQYDRGEAVAQIAQTMATAILSPMLGLSLMTAVGASGKLRAFSRGALTALGVLGAAIWIVLAVALWHWLFPPVAAQIVEDPAAPELVVTGDPDPVSNDANYDSNLELAVARAKMAKANGEQDRAVQILEQALRDARAQGRDVGHVELHRVLGWLYAGRGELAAAMVMFETVARLTPEDSPEHTEALQTLDRLARRAGLATAPVSTPSQVLEQDTDSSEKAEER